MKFKPNELITLLENPPLYNLSESTSKDLRFKELMDEEFLEELGELSLGYGRCRGYDRLRRLIAQKLDTEKEQILVTSGGLYGVFLSILCLCNQEDEVITVQPNFSSIIDLIEGLGFKKKLVKLNFEEGYQVDVDKMLEAVSARTKLIILVSPLNPTGTIMQRETIEILSNKLKEKHPKCKLLIDETYREAVYNKRKPQRSFSGYSDQVITVSSLSKCHGTPGLRIGWLCTSDKTLFQQLASAKVNTMISNSVLDELVAIRILEKEAPIIDVRKRHMTLGLKLTSKWIERNEKWVEWIKPTAGALCCIGLKKSIFDDSKIDVFYKLAEKENIKLAPGDWFGEEKRFFRLGFGYMPLRDLSMALKKLDQVLLLSASANSSNAITIVRNELY